VGKTVVVSYPSMAPQIVGSSLGLVAEDVICSNEEPISFGANRGGKMGYWRRGMAVSVGVVYLGESIEASFGVNVATAEREDLVGRGRRVRVQRLRPGQVRIVAGRLRLRRWSRVRLL
jgi:hypothetical protein